MVDKPIGLTKDVGWQIGVRRTVDVPLDAAWEFLTSIEGLNLWLGETNGVDLAPGTAYVLADGAVGEVRVFNPGSHLRITWQPYGWTRSSTIQIRVLPKGDNTVIAFHQEHLPDADAREQRRAHFAAVLDELESVVAVE